MQENRINLFLFKLKTGISNIRFLYISKTRIATGKFEISEENIFRNRYKTLCNKSIILFTNVRNENDTNDYTKKKTNPRKLLRNEMKEAIEESNTEDRER